MVESSLNVPGDRERDMKLFFNLNVGTPCMRGGGRGHTIGQSGRNIK